MDISTATTFASGLVGLIVPAFVQAFKKYIPSGYVGLVSLAASILFGTIAIAATRGIRWHLHVGSRPCRSRPCRSRGRLADRVHARQSF